MMAHHLGLLLWLLLAVAPLRLHAHIPDLQLVFKTEAMGLSTKSLHIALHITDSLHQSRRLQLTNAKDAREHQMTLLCTPYYDSKSIHSFLLNIEADDHQYYPVFVSQSEDRVCYIYHGTTLTSTDTTTAEEQTVHPLVITPVPHVLKIDPSIALVLDGLQPSPRPAPITLELGLLTGVANPTSMCCDQHKEVFADILASTVKVLTHPASREEHQRSFFYTHHLPLDTDNIWMSVTGEDQGADDMEKQHRAAYQAPVDHSQCQALLSLMTVTYTDTHISVTVSTEDASISLKSVAPCVRLLTAVAALHPTISHISAHTAHVTMKEESVASPAAGTSESVNYAVAAPATDQNAYVQSGTSDQYPYTSGLGLDGTGYVLGMIDTGIDDLSCFLRDFNSSDPQQTTTRTAKEAYGAPVTEPFRRKVIQYVAWADDSYREGRDHGSW
jgi:hypothetical protein